MAFAIFCAACSVAAPPADDLQAFWQKFRAAAGAHDAKALAALTQFPFETRGVDDADPVKKHEPAAFPELVKRMLSQNTGLAVKEETHAQLIARTTHVAAQGRGDSFRVGDLVFHRINGKWRLVRAYLDE